MPHLYLIQDFFYRVPWSVALFVILAATMMSRQAILFFQYGYVWELHPTVFFSDMMLIVAIMDGAEVLKSLPHGPWWQLVNMGPVVFGVPIVYKALLWGFSPIFHGVVLLLTAIAWAIFRITTRAVRREWVDLHHDILHGPVLTYSLVSVAPALFVGALEQGRWWEFAFALSCFFNWVGTNILDTPQIVKHNDYQQFKKRALETFRRC